MFSMNSAKLLNELPPSESGFRFFIFIPVLPAGRGAGFISVNIHLFLSVGIKQKSFSQFLSAVATLLLYSGLRSSRKDFA